MKDFLKLALAIFVIWLLLVYADNKAKESTQLCQEKYGAEYQGTDGAYGKPDCVSPNGEGRWL